MKLLLFYLCLLFCSQTIYAVHQKVLLKDVNVLTLQQGQFTTGRRGSPVPQLKCVGGTAWREADKIQTVQCTNTGFDGRDYNWKCEAQMDKALKFGKVAVSCEGYDYPDDSYVLVGSCGLEYTLDYTGHQTIPNVQPPRVHQRITTTTTHYNTEDALVTLFTVFFALICMVFVVSCCCTPTPSRVYIPPVNPDMPPRVYGPMDRYVVPISPVTPVVVTQPSTTSSFVDGMIVGSALSHRNVPTHTHTETIISDSGSYSPGPFSRRDTSSYSTSDNTHTSTGYGGTNRR
ncbi:store-operated calcium entry-associated regulatory factor [Fadolivirus algeromassiliense]|jgi:hypothetical protein|uniref:Store-operated calcium entry-associated regulatory factor n=1 Tax=Fadolivirus FV1/VV64 TaxID=3070911 RepID=A0A7D3UVB7_9VIRU|nr:store-operated calcium entry-associated regulatory factor [Fadolivirus algeromassiliense]QKF93914.1 store-operated calcium entry-associated regulatory factor [Fadolivirus FV1/VV64]